MTPDAQWPALPSYHTFTPADHAAHTSPKGIPYPDSLMNGVDARKAAKQLMKFSHKPFIRLKNTKPRTTKRKRKEK